MVPTRKQVSPEDTHDIEHILQDYQDSWTKQGGTPQEKARIMLKEAGKSTKRFALLKASSVVTKG